MTTVVIPSCLRTPTLQTLESLTAQTTTADDLEVIIVADGADPTVAGFVAERRTPFTLRVVR